MVVVSGAPCVTVVQQPPLPLPRFHPLPHCNITGRSRDGSARSCSRQGFQLAPCSRSIVVPGLLLVSGHTRGKLSLRWLWVFLRGNSGLENAAEQLKRVSVRVCSA